jgi:hypothetical protein
MLCCALFKLGCVPLSSDGAEYPFLAKPKDDLRKDYRLMDFAGDTALVLVAADARLSFVCPADVLLLPNDSLSSQQHYRDMAARPGGGGLPCAVSASHSS